MMLNRYLLPSSVVSAAIVFIASPVLAQQTLPAQEIGQIARETVVRIEASNGAAGSGVIINREQERGKNVYVVLTSKQIFQDRTQQYNIITPVYGESEKRQKIQISSVAEISGADLVKVRFHSDRNYQTAVLATDENPAKCAGVYLSGFSKNLNNKKRVFQFISVFHEDADDIGMIGAPIFDISGRVVSINGTVDKAASGGNEATDECKCTGTRGFRSRRRFGLSLRNFLQLFDRNQNNRLDSPKPSYKSPFSEGIAAGGVRGDAICVNPLIEKVEAKNIEVEK